MNELDSFVTGQAAEGMDVEGLKKTKKVKKSKKVAEEGGEVVVKAVKEKKVKEPKEKKPARDNVGYINGLMVLDSVRKALQIAVAKKAKSAGKEIAIARYEEEISAAKGRLAELIELAKSSGDFVKGLIDLGEEPNKILTHFIADKENMFETWLNERAVKVSRGVLKQISNEIPISFLTELPFDLHEAVVNRHTKGDFRLQAVCKQANFMYGVEAGEITQNGSKWVLPGQEVVADETVSSDSVSSDDGLEESQS